MGYIKEHLADKESVANRSKQLFAGEGDSLIEPTLDRWFGKEQTPEVIAKKAQVSQWLKEANPLGYARAYQLFSKSDDINAGKLHQLTMPTLFITGEFDPNSTPEMSQKMSDESNGEVIILKNQKHFINYDIPDKLNAIIIHFLTFNTINTLQIED